MELNLLLITRLLMIYVSAIYSTLKEVDRKDSVSDTGGLQWFQWKSPLKKCTTLIGGVKRENDV